MEVRLQQVTRARVTFSAATHPRLRSVSGTPSFFVNGISVDADPSWTLADWQQVIY
jgi:hypothetical protein